MYCSSDRWIETAADYGAGAGRATDGTPARVVSNPCMPWLFLFDPYAVLGPAIRALLGPKARGPGEHAADALERELVEREFEILIVALRLDLIGPDDFLRPPSSTAV